MNTRGHKITTTRHQTSVKRCNYYIRMQTDYTTHRTDVKMQNECKRKQNDLKSHKTKCKEMQNNYKWMQNDYTTHTTDIKRYIQNNYKLWNAVLSEGISFSLGVLSYVAGRGTVSDNASTPRSFNGTAFTHKLYFFMCHFQSSATSALTCTFILK